ncbi:MAG: D-alanyl-D-alanine carboxypeptidase family protein [Acutalibacteraceae bacterium]|nr:D-alanyl-D-alanine carboxypeptidase family protein [Acutalibacteraceae bacterium]
MKKKLSVLSTLIMIIIILVNSVVPVGAVKNSINFKPKTDIFYLVNMDTDTVVYSKNSDKKCYPASTTKIMTYIVVTENIKNPENEKVKIKQELLDQLAGTGSSLSGLEDYVGEELTVFQLLHCMMVSSGNDAALVLADYVGKGSEEEFVKLMNSKAKELGCKNTKFMNSHGLHDDNQYTTAEDLFVITRYAMTTPYFTDITDTVEYYIDGDDEEPLTNTNLMLHKDEEDYYYEYAKGIKTGTTDEAGRCLVSVALKDNVSYMCIAMNAPCYDKDGNELETNYAIQESKKLYEWVYSNVTMRTVLGQDDKLASVNVNYCETADKVNLVPEYSYSTMLSKDIKDSDIVITTQCQQQIDAPVTRGTVLGTATVSYKGEQLTKVNLIAAENLEKSDTLYFKAIAMNILTSKLFITIVSVIAGLFVLYVVFVNVFAVRRKKRSK